MAKLQFEDGKLCISVFLPPHGNFVHVELPLDGLREPDMQALVKASTYASDIMAAGDILDQISEALDDDSLTLPETVYGIRDICSSEVVEPPFTPPE